MVIIKRLDTAKNWPVWVTPVMSITGSTSDYILLNSDAGKVSAASVTNLWGGNVPTSTTIGVGDSSESNASGGDYIAYCWHSVSGYSKIGSYTGDGGSTRSFTVLDFQPDFVMVKSVTQSDGRWHMYDSARGVKKRLLANSNGVEYDEATGGSAGLNSFDSTGWTIGNDGHMNQNGETYLYMAFKE